MQVKSCMFIHILDSLCAIMTISMDTHIWILILSPDISIYLPAPLSFAKSLPAHSRLMGVYSWIEPDGASLQTVLLAAVEPFMGSHGFLFRPPLPPPNCSDLSLPVFFLPPSGRLQRQPYPLAMGPFQSLPWQCAALLLEVVPCLHSRTAYVSSESG